MGYISDQICTNILTWTMKYHWTKAPFHKKSMWTIWLLPDYWAILDRSAGELRKTKFHTGG